VKQVLQNMKNGVTRVFDVPAPNVEPAGLIVATTVSLISAGTERMLVEFSKASLLNKAMKQPERVKDVLQKIKTDGLLTTFDAVKTKLGQPIALGYCNVGIVIEVGTRVTGFANGDRVVSNGPHAEIVRAAVNVSARIPDQVDDETASFAVVASIGLQSVRLAEPTLGESFVVIGAGLIGNLTVQILVANGCRVLAVDLDQRKLDLAAHFGAEVCNPSKGRDPVATALNFSRGRGVDGVIIAASTASSDPLSQAALMCRKRGRIIVVGVTGMELKRTEFYEKELSFQVSCSYGPGRHDPQYEQLGYDYPFGFVRWTEQRNLEAVLDLMAAGKIDIKPLITDRFKIDDAANAYDELSKSKATLGILLQYPSPVAPRLDKEVRFKGAVQRLDGKPVLTVIGAGNYASRILIPAFKQAGAVFGTLAATGGLNVAVHGERMEFNKASTDVTAVLSDKASNAVIIATRHDSHADLTSKALLLGKHVFVEKPLAIDKQGIAAVQAAVLHSPTPPQLMVGFNRRFAPHVQKLQSLLAAASGPKAIILTMNAGAIPANHWTQDLTDGGGRIVGEACHLIDLARFIAGSPIVHAEASGMTSKASSRTLVDTASITFRFEDGSIATIHYFANGSARFSKERIEVFSGGSVLQIDNFRKMTGFGWPGFKSMNLWRQDKGQAACAKAFLTAIETGKPAIPIDEIFEVASVTLEIADKLSG
jgi:predicted dehydrogenase/threonine dehydrogenase-like Zn-dependent dehydrogenase